MTSQYQNTSTNVAAITGGSTKVTIASNVGQGADIDCRYCRLQPATTNSGVTRVCIGAAYNATTNPGTALAPYPTLTPYAVDNISKLYFSGTNNDVIYIEYFK